MASRGTVGNLLIQMRVQLGQLRTDVKTIEQTFNTGFANIKTSAASFGRDLAGSLGVGLSVGAVIGFGKQILALADNLKNLSEQTGISAQTLSGIKSTLEESGSSLEGFASGIFRLQKELGAIKNESDPAAQAIKQLGLDLNKLRESSPEDFLEAIVDAFGKIENPLNRAALMFQLLGRNSRDLGPALQALVGHLDELRERGLTDEQVKLLDDFGDSLTAMKNAALIAAASLTANLTPALAKLYEWLLKVEVGLLATKKALTLFGSTENMDRMLADLRKRLDEVKDFNANVGQPSSHQEVAPRFKPPVDDAALKKAADEAKRLAEELKKLAETIGESNSKLEEQLIELRYGAAAAEDYALAQQEMREAAKGMTGDILQEQDRRRALTEQLREEKLARDDLRKLAEQSRKDTPFVEESTRFGLNADELKEFAENENRLNEATKHAREEWAKFQDQAALGLISDDTQRQITEIGVGFTRLAERMLELGEAAGISQEEVQNAIDAIGQGVKRQIDQIKPPKTEAEKLGARVGESITGGIRNTLMGIETGQQTVSEGLKNMMRNIGLELQFLAFDEMILKPINAFAEGFVGGLFGAIGTAAEENSKKLGEQLGKAIKQAVDELQGSEGFGIFKSIFGIIGSIFGASSSTGSIPIGGGGYGTIGGPVAEKGGLIFTRGSMLSFASGGAVPIMAHAGEFVVNRAAVNSVGAGVISQINQSGKMPGSNVTVDMKNVTIVPKAPWITADEAFQIMINDADNQGPHAQLLARRSNILSRG